MKTMEDTRIVCYRILRDETPGRWMIAGYTESGTAYIMGDDMGFREARDYRAHLERAR
jgi:hypothetical protein